MNGSIRRLGRCAPVLLPALVAVALAGSSAAALDPPAAAWPVAPLPHPLEPAATGGVEAVDRALAQLSGHRRLLIVGAHPDDEDNALLTWVTHGLGGEAAYLSLSRGEGGQNLIGPQLGVGLGLLRTGELLAARRIDGARQLFTRAFDFGYTRSLDETLGRWPRAAILEDAVRAVRRFRPQVMVAIFPADAGAGHGQHQMSAVIAGEAFAAAGEPDRYPELTAAGLPPWSPSALFRRAWRDVEATHRFPLDAVDPFGGRSLAQLAAASRSSHRSQDMGREQPIGGGGGGLTVLDGARRRGRGARQAAPEPFADLDTRLAAIATPLPGGPERRRIEERLARIEGGARELRRQIAPSALDEAVPRLAELAVELDAVRAELAALAARGPATGPAGDPGPPEVAGTPGRGASHRVAAVAALVEEKRAVVGAALLAAAGIAVEAVVERPRLVPGGSARATLSVWRGAPAGPQPLPRAAVVVRRLELTSPARWAVRGPAESAASGAGELAAGELREVAFEVAIPPDAEPTVPYFLRRARAGDLYDWTGVAQAVRGEPFQPAPLIARFDLLVGGVAVRVERAAVHRAGDQAVGEVRRPVIAVPALEVAVEPGRLIRPAAGGGVWELAVELRSNADRPLAGRLELDLGGGRPGELGRFALEPGERWSTRASFAPPARGAPGVSSGEVAAVLDAGGRFASTVRTIDEPHVRPVAWIEPASVAIHALDLALPAVGRVGYVRGASDRLPEVLAAVGLPIVPLDAGGLAGDLSRYDAVVVGSRAYESDPSLARVNGRLLAYARAGGLLLIQYQQYPWVAAGLPPHPLAIARPHGRVTDEASPVELLVPEHPVFHEPNRIGPADWDGWVQERGLYFADTWDDAWTPLLALRDPGQPEQRGALLVAPLGEGTVVYTGLAFFRQLPAGVPGAWRLFANLLALGGR